MHKRWRWALLFTDKTRWTIRPIVAKPSVFTVNMCSDVYFYWFFQCFSSSLIDLLIYRSMYRWMCICIHAGDSSMHTCICSLALTFICSYMLIHIASRVHVCLRACIHAYVLAHCGTYIIHVFKRAYVHRESSRIHTRARTHMDTYAHIHTNICTCIHTRARLCTHE